MKTLNFDAMTVDELLEFWKTWHVTTKKKAVVFTGERKDAKKIMETLANYAINKSCAVRLRLEGDIVGASNYEHSCQLCYDSLPADVRW